MRQNLKFWFVAASVKFYQTALPHLVDIEIFPQSVVNKSTLSESWIRKVRILGEFKFQLGQKMYSADLIPIYSDWFSTIALPVAVEKPFRLYNYTILKTSCQWISNCRLYIEL